MFVALQLSSPRSLVLRQVSRENPRLANDSAPNIVPQDFRDDVPRSGDISRAMMATPRLQLAKLPPILQRELDLPRLFANQNGVTHFRRFPGRGRAVASVNGKAQEH